MGHCWTTGKKVNGKWKFTKCNGNANRGPNNCFPESNKDKPRCRDCAEWCKNYKDAVDVVEDWERMNNE